MARSRSATAWATAGPTTPANHRRHGVNMQLVTDPDGRLLWISPALPGRTYDLTAARPHRIIWLCERQGVPLLADRAYMGAGPWVTTPSDARRAVASRPPGKPSTARCPRHGHQSSVASHDEVVADLPPVPIQPESNDVNRGRRPHPGAATLKEPSGSDPYRGGLPPGPACPVAAAGRGGYQMVRNGAGGERDRSRVRNWTLAGPLRSGGRRGGGRGGGRRVRVGRERW